MRARPFASRTEAGLKSSELGSERLAALLSLLTVVYVFIAVLGVVVVGFLAHQSFSSFALPLAAPVLAAVAFFATGRWISDGRRTVMQLEVVDVQTVLVASLVHAWMTVTSPQMSGASSVLQSLTLLLLVLRAAFVPSHPVRTVAVGALATLIGAATLRWLPPEARWGEGPMAQAGWFGFVTFSLLTLGITGNASKVIFRLHEQVKEAVRLGQYTLVEKIGEGGMGTVWRADHAILRRPTAIKLMAAGQKDEAAIKRFDREAQLTSTLTHPNTVAVFDYGRTDDGTLYFAMEYVNGVNLQELVERDGPLDAARTVHLLTQIVGSLGEAHELGLLHRDVKPANILVGTRAGISDFVKVVDFGLVKAMHVAPDALASHAGSVAGTPMYMAPETLLTPEEVDGRADIYALGCVAYFMLAGVPVFEGTSVIEICSNHIHQIPTLPSERAHRQVPASLEALVVWCLAKKPEGRPPSMKVVAAELRACAEEAWASEAPGGEPWQGGAEPYVRSSRARAAVNASAATVLDVDVTAAKRQQRTT